MLQHPGQARDPMDNKIDDNPPMNRGDSENGISARSEAGSPIRHDGRPAAENRGTRAPRSGSGVVIGSGAGAGGAGAEEDFDSDPAGGGGSMDTPRDA